MSERSSNPTGGNGRTWTTDQERGITTVGRGVLVSAAAGSGKTAVLAERCAHLVCNCDCGVDELLVVTFTEAAAAEMKSRIQQALQERLRGSDDPHLARQLAQIERIQVSTLHGFCARLLRQHFHLLELDPNFVILDADEASLLRHEVARDLFGDYYARDSAGDFQRFIDDYGDGDDARLMEKMLALHDLLCSLVEPVRWMDDALGQLEQAANLALEESTLGRQLIALTQKKLDALGGQARNAAAVIRGMKGFEKYDGHVHELCQIIEHWGEVLRSAGIDALAEMSDISLPKLPTIANATPGKEVAYSLIDAVKKQMKKDSPLFASMQFTAAQWRQGVAATVPHARILLGLVKDFTIRYRRAKDDVRSLDFADLERFTLRVLRDKKSNGPSAVPSAVARMCHGQFKHVLVDEYQDINKIQDAILGFVSTECLRDRRNAPASNLFSVGDVKQSIYGFRLAEPERFLERQRRFREAGQTLGTVIDLQANFRSRGPLLEVLNALFERLMVEEAADITYDASHHLRPGADYPAGTAEYFSGAPLELHLLPARPDFSEVEPADGDADSSDPSDLDRTDIEAAFIAGRIRQLLGADGRARMNVIEKLDGAMRPRPIEYRDIVILLRSLKFKADQFVDVLRRSGIPLHSSAGTGYFQSMEVRDMLALLNLLDNQRQDIPMAAVLRSPLSGIASTDDALARIHLAYRDADPPVPFHQAVVRYAAEQHDELAAALDDFLGHLRVWRELAHRRPLAEVIWTILDRTGYLAYCSGLPDGEQRCANLLHLHERARQFGTFQRQGLYRFMRFLDSLQAEHDVAQPSIAAESENVVRVMSIHGAKGLEFPVVFLPDLGKKFNFQSCQGPILFDRRAGLGLSAVDEERRIRYPSLASTVVQNRLKQQTLAEELRLLYVATTRAREHLILVGTCADSARETWTNRWTNHRGPLGVEDILGAGSMLDWIGPVSAAINSERERISITMHGAEEIARWPNPQSPLPKFSARQIALARLEPLADAPAENAAASAIIARLDHRYGFRDFAKLPASKAVTALTKSAAASVGIGERYSASALSSPLPAPKCVIGEIPSATDKGTATHLVLEYLDFAKPCDPGDVERQIESMVDRRLLTSAQAALVDRPCLEWFLNSSVGRLVCSNAGSLLRELPFYLAVPPGVVDPAIAGQPAPEDCVMIRGRIDLVVDQPAGLTIIDYKTDNVTAETIQLRAELYAAQMKLYREALTRITGRPVCAAHLIFLTPRMIV